MFYTSVVKGTDVIFAFWAEQYELYESVHLYFQRAKSFELLFGDRSYHRELLAQRVGIQAVDFVSPKLFDITLDLSSVDRKSLKAVFYVASQPTVGSHSTSQLICTDRGRDDVH